MLRRTDLIEFERSFGRSDRCSDEATMTHTINDVSVHVNGKEIELNEFVKTLFGNTVVGMVSSLRLDQPPERIEVCVEVQSSRKRKVKV
jgi:hypothetical protein